MRILCIPMLLVVLLIAACTGTGTSPTDPQSTTTTTIVIDHKPGDPVRISGRLGQGFSISRNGGRSIASAISHIASVPVVAGTPELKNKKETQVAPDGSFNVEIVPNPEESEMFLLIDKNATTLEGKSSGFITMRSNTGADLVSIPVASLKRDLDFGTAENNGKDAVSNVPLESQKDAFSMSFDQLLETAYLDSLYKGAENQYVNQDLATNQWYRYMYGQSFTGTLSSAIGAFSSSEGMLSRRSFSFGMDVLDPSGYTADQAVSGAVNIEIVPPEEIFIPVSTDSFSPTKPMSSKNLPSSFVINKMPGIALPDGFTSGFGIGGSIRDPLRGGFWRVRVDGVEKALFDMDPAVSFTTDGAFMFYVPSFKVDSDGTGLVTSVTLEWRAWDPSTRTYRKVEDLSTFLQIGSGWMMGLNSNEPETHEYFNKGTTVNRFEHTWYVSDPPRGGIRLTALTTAYAIAGFSFGFNLQD